MIIAGQMWERCVCSRKGTEKSKNVVMRALYCVYVYQKSPFHTSPTKRINDRKSMSMERKRVDENPFKCGPSTSSSSFDSYSPSTAMQNSTHFFTIFREQSGTRGFVDASVAIHRKTWREKSCNVGRKVKSTSRRAL